MLEPIKFILLEALRIGTCSWKYDSWKGLVYRDDRKYRPNDYLKDYAKYFNTVEIDQWFWSLFPHGAKLHDVETVRIYSESVPDDFLFTVKVPNSITLTHYYAKQPKGLENLANQPNPHFLNVDLLNRFLETLEPMKGKLGSIMFQFEYLNKNKMPLLKVFLDKLGRFFKEAPEGFSYSIETRNKNYLCKDYFSFLKDKGLGCVLLEGYYMPPIGEIIQKFDTNTTDYSVVRLHGPDRQRIEERTGGLWNEIVAPKDEGVKATASLLHENAVKEIATFINVNNHYEGSAPLTIQRFLGLL